MRLNTPQKISLIYFVILLIYWVALFLTDTKTGFYSYLYSFLFGLPPLIGGFISIFVSRLWGGFQSNIGKGIFFIGLGLFLWGCGEMIWSYYNFILGVQAPYPSFVDLGYAPGMFLYAVGAFYLASLSETELRLRSKTAKLFVIVAPVVIGVASYHLLVNIARGGVLVSDGKISIKTLLDILYPLGDFTALTIAAVISGLSFPYMRGKYKFDIAAVLLGIGVMFIADVAFSYTTTVGTYYNGDWADLFFTIGTSLLTFGVLGFYTLKE